MALIRQFEFLVLKFFLLLRMDCLTYFFVGLKQFGNVCVGLSVFLNAKFTKFPGRKAERLRAKSGARGIGVGCPGDLIRLRMGVGE